MVSAVAVLFPSIYRQSIRPKEFDSPKREPGLPDQTSLDSESPGVLRDLNGKQSGRYISEKVDTLDPDGNKEEIGNFTRFHDKLILRLGEKGYPESFARELAQIIRSNMLANSGITDPKILAQVIERFMGTPDQVETIIEVIGDAVGEIADEDMAEGKGEGKPPSAVPSEDPAY